MVYPSRTPMPDPLDLKKVQSLEECELNERVESPNAASFAGKIGLTLAVSVSVGSLTARLAFDLLCEELAVAWRVSLVVGAAYLVVVWVMHASHLRYASSVFAVWVFVCLFAWAQSFLISPLHTVRIALLCSAILALACGRLVTKQYVFFATANMSHTWEKSLRWRSYWARVTRFQDVPNRPDVTSFRRRALPVAIGVVCGLAMSNSPQPLTSTLFGYTLGLVGTALLFGHMVPLRGWQFVRPLSPCGCSCPICPP